MPPSVPRDARILVLLNPGQMSRHWLLGIASGAERLGVLAGTLELGQVWEALESAGSNIDEVRNQLAGQIIRFCQQRRVTHVVSYLHNGAFEAGLFPDEKNMPVTLFARAGLRHIMLWSDHPNWALDGAALNPTVAEILAHPRHTHILKSPAAAEEAASVLNWPNVHSMHMGEDMGVIAPAKGVDVIHDAVIIMADAMPLPRTLVSYLDEDDPNPSDLANTMRSEGIAGARVVIDRYVAGDVDRVLCQTLTEDWIDARIRRPQAPFWSLLEQLDDAHADAIKVLKRDPRLYYDTVKSLQQVTSWRRFFWPAWLSRRVSLGVYGSAASQLNIPTPPGGGTWIPNNVQPQIYARGKVAININAGHDESGLTHKPFQIGASGVPLLHHATRHIEECFEIGDEAITWDRGPELVDTIRDLAAKPKKRAAMAEAIRDRVERDHDWTRRVATMLEFAAEDAEWQAGMPTVAA